ncbi:MAG: HNH endonuclease [Oscillospiraceae bacterium]|nr:HNH endonuclease [Oscillospiraceae bacterium]
MTNAAFGTNFTKETMKSYKQNHKLRSGTPRSRPKGHPSKKFPSPVKEFIYANYKNTGPTKMAAMLKEKFGLDYKISQIKSFYANHKLNSGLTGQFKKGCASHNKGKKGWNPPGCEKGHFQKGSTPANKLPIGTIMTKSGGYVWKKIGEGARDWRQLHILNWEETNGPVPKGFNIIFKDGNRQNCAVDNLMMVSLAENAVMNKYRLRFYDPEHTETGLLIAKVKIAAGKRKKRKHAKETEDNA